MPLFRVYYKVCCHDRTLENGYDLVLADQQQQARTLLRSKMKQRYHPLKLSIQTSFKSWIPRNRH